MGGGAQFQREAEHPLNKFVQDFFTLNRLDIANEEVRNELESVNRVARAEFLNDTTECLCSHQSNTIFKQILEYKPDRRIEELQ